MRQVADSLTGRASYVRLHGLTRREALGHGAAGAWDILVNHPVESWSERLDALALPEGDWRADARTGGFPWPRLHVADQDDRTRWLDSYVRTHIDRDLRELATVEDPLRYHLLMQVAAARVGNLLNQTELGRDARLGQAQVHRWLALMETSYLLTRVPAFGRNATTRLIKSPKLYWNDTGVAMRLTERHAPSGADFENLVFADLATWRDAQLRPVSVSTWRTADGREIDFVVEAPPRGLLAVEVKSGATPTPRDARHLVEFVSEYAGDRAKGVLLHEGERTIAFHDRVVAVPWWRVL